MLELLQNGGAPVMLLLALGLMALVASAGVAIASLRASRGGTLAMGAALLAAALTLVAIGIAGWLYGRAQVDEALLVLATSHEEIRAAGYAEAAISLWAGMLAAAVPLLVGLGAMLRAVLSPAERAPGGRG